MNYSIGLSALRASQHAIETVSHNLANANTEGYHRQRVEMMDRGSRYVAGPSTNPVSIGTGVNVGHIDRIRNQILERSYTNSISDLKTAQQTLSIDGQIESLFKPGEGSLHQALGGFFDEISRLSVNPSELVQRNAVVQRGVNIADRTRDISNRLTDLKTSVKQQIDVEVKDLNNDLKALSDVQERIRVSSFNTTAPNDLLDQRDQIVNRIAQKIDVQRQENGENGLGLSFAGYAVSQGLLPVQFESHTNDQGEISFRLQGTDRDLNIASGSLVSLSEAYNHTINEYQTKINEFAKNLIREVDQAHAKGVGSSGAYSLVRSSRAVKSVTLPLDDAGLAFPVAAGDLFFSVTAPGGDKRTFSVAIDPSTDSLTDIANKISTIGDVQAVVDSKTGGLSIVAQPGYRFDFSGNLETVPGRSGVTGTSVAKIAGRYQANVNQSLSIAVIGSGEIGKTAGLMAQVTDELSGKVIAEFSVGEDYEAGTALKIGDGVTVSFGAGTVNNGDAFQTHLVADADRTGILSALGLNSFFSGNDATDIAVSQRILNDPTELSSSRSGDVADTANLAGLLQLRDAPVAGENKLTLEEYLNQSSSDIGFRVKKSLYFEESVSALNAQYQSEIASVSGVDLNEELISLSRYQKQYEAAVQVMRTMDTMLDDLFSIVG